VSTPDLLRLIAAGLAALVSGAVLMVLVRYLYAARRRSGPGRILARHVAEVSVGTFGQTTATAWALYDGLDKIVTQAATTARVVMWTVGMLLLLIGVIEVGAYQRKRTRAYPQRQEQVRTAIREAMNRRRVTGPRAADHVALLATNAVLRLEGTPVLDEPRRPARRAPEPTEPVDAVDPEEATGHGRHELREDRRPQT
jgi:hypothetical protein